MIKCIQLALGILSVLLVSCSPQLLSGTEYDYKNENYKAIVNNSNLSNYRILQHYIPVMDSALVALNNYVVENIDNYNEFTKTYGIYKDSLGIDSSYFNKNRIIGFFIVVIGGEIDNYTYDIKDDSLFLNCEIKLYPERQNGYLIPKQLVPYIITFGNTK